jgi:hypothetical protein
MADQPTKLGALLEAFGPEAELAPGATIEHAVEFERRPAQLVATLRKDGRLDVRLQRREGLVWEGEMDLGDVGRWSAFAARIARGDVKPASPPAAQATQQPDAKQRTSGWTEKEEQLARGLLPPIVGETWVMDVRIDDDDGGEVRYRGVNIGGEEYGAPRVLPKTAFEEMFVAAHNGYRMFVRVLEVAEHDVVYQRMNVQRALAGKPRGCPMIVFLANFLPEAGAY